MQPCSETAGKEHANVTCERQNASHFVRGELETRASPVSTHMMSKFAFDFFR
jgi:hypothetical protein